MKYCQNKKCLKIRNDLAFVCGMLVEQNNIPDGCEWIVAISRREKNDQKNSTMF